MSKTASQSMLKIVRSPGSSSMISSLLYDLRESMLEEEMHSLMFLDNFKHREIFIKLIYSIL